MEFIKANLHMDRIKCKVNTQITLEEDKNISDINQDAAGILMEKARIVLEEVRPGKDQLSLKGRMVYEVLYLTDEEEGRLNRIQGEIPFEEKIRAEGIESIDTVDVETQIEDLRTGLINSRKISIRALVNFCVKDIQIYDEEILVQAQQEGLEIKKESISQTVVAVDCKDIFRVKEELELPASLPPVQEVLWKFLDLGKVEIRPLEDNIGIQGEMRIFILYEGEGEDRPIRAYETTIPFSGNVECPGSSSGMISDIVPQLDSWNLNVKENYDGEERMVEVEIVLNMPIRLMENKDVEMITDVYGITQEAIPVFANGSRRKMYDKSQTKIKISQVMTIPASAPHILQICHVESSVLIEEVNGTKEGLQIEGILPVTVLYLSDDDRKPYNVIKDEIPFSYIGENVEVIPNSKWKVKPSLEQCSGILLDGERVEVKAVIGLEIMMEECWQQPMLRDIQIQPLQPDKLKHIPGMAVYIPNEPQSLWEVGKKYMTSVDSIRTLNQLTSDRLEKGQKLLIVKEA